MRKNFVVFLLTSVAVIFLYASIRAYFVREKFNMLKQGMTQSEVVSVVGDAYITVGYGRQEIGSWEVWYLYKQPGASVEYICIFDADKKLILTEKGDPWTSDMEYEKLIEERAKAVYD
jgi:hypothetical protein